MRIRDRRIALWIAIPGLVVCWGAIQGFVIRVLHGELPIVTGTRDHYLAVGKAYSEGFTAGFFLCFFLTLSAIGVTAWLDRRRERLDVKIPVGPVGLVKTK